MMMVVQTCRMIVGTDLRDDGGGTDLRDDGGYRPEG